MKKKTIEIQHILDAKRHENQRKKNEKIHLIFEIIVNLFAKLLLLYKNINNINENENEKKNCHKERRYHKQYSTDLAGFK